MDTGARSPLFYFIIIMRLFVVIKEFIEFYERKSPFGDFLVIYVFKIDKVKIFKL
jgi:hypothetical protein